MATGIGFASDVLYFKVGDANRADYETRGMRQFRPFDDKPYLSMSYYEVPADVLEDPDQCVHWVQRAVAVAVASKKPGPRPKSKVASERHMAGKRAKPTVAGKSKAAEHAKRAKPKIAAKAKVARKRPKRPRRP
jgi:DNA transformation protein